MKFVSKAANYLLILRSSVAPEPLLGRPGIPGLSIRFEDGIAEVTDEKICEMVMQSPYYNRDFHCAEDIKPGEITHKEIEPAHSITELKYGQAVKTQSSPQKVVLPPALTEHVNKSIEEGIKAGLEKLMPDLVAQLSVAADKVSGETDKKVPAKNKTKSKTKKKTTAKKIVATVPVAPVGEVESIGTVPAETTEIPTETTETLEQQV